MAPACEILMICGSLRSGSGNAAALRTAQLVAPPGVRAVVYEGLQRLPHFNPDDDHDPLPRGVIELRHGIQSADAVLFSTPEYAGALPGSFKNLLDWTVGGGEIYEKPVAWINTSGAPNGAADAYASLRTVLRYTGAVLVEAACAHIPVARHAVEPNGIITDPSLRREILATMTALAGHVGGSAARSD